MSCTWPCSNAVLDQTCGYDEASGSVYNYFRDYDSLIGRYVESDPVGLEGGANTYAYVQGNPLSYVDAQGLELGATFSSMNRHTNDIRDGRDATPNCRPDTCMKNCLDGILGEDVSSIDVIADSAFARLHGYATTRKNTIYVNDTCSGFFRNTFTVIEESYHVSKQWNTDRLTVFRYLRDNVIDGGYDNNRWEVEAKDFARNNLEALRKCLDCCK